MAQTLSGMDGQVPQLVPCETLSRSGQAPEGRGGWPRRVVLVVALSLVAAAGCSEAEPEVGSPASPDASVAVDELYTGAVGAPSSSEAPSPDAPAPATASPEPTWPPETPTDGPDAGVPYGTWGRLVLGADEMYSLTSGEQYVIDQAVAILADECQAKEGFDVEITVGDGSGDNFGPPMVDETLGLIDASAAPYGYRGNPNRSDGEVSGGLSVGWADTEDAREAVWECQRQAAGQLTGGEPADEKLPWDIKHAAEAEVGGDPDYRDATQKWSECMARGGFDYAAPADPWLDPAHGYKSCDEDGALSELALDRPSRLSRTDLEELLAGVECEAPIPVTDAEIQVAEADVECKAEVGLVPAFRAALWKAQEARIEANLPALEKRLELERKRLERAGKIIAER